MSFVKPDAHKIDLRSALDARGWDIALEEPASNAWWINELWRITSRWRPVGATLYVSFIAEPSADIGLSGRVGDVEIGDAPASKWLGGESDARFALHPDWPSQMKAIVAYVSRSRNGME